MVKGVSPAVASVDSASPVVQCICAGARSSYHAAAPMWTPAQARTAGVTPDRGMSSSALGPPGSMMGSADYSLHQQGSATQMSSQIQLAASQLAAPPDAALHNPLAFKQLMLQVGFLQARCHAVSARMTTGSGWFLGTLYALSQLLIHCASDN